MFDIGIKLKKDSTSITLDIQMLYPN